MKSSINILTFEEFYENINKQEFSISNLDIYIKYSRLRTLHPPSIGDREAQKDMKRCNFFV